MKNEMRSMLGPWQRLGLGSAGQRWAALGSAGQRWAALGSATLAAVSSAGHLSAALGIGAQRWALAFAQAAQLWAALAVCRYSRCPAVKKPLISAALKSL